jgi:1-phosphofructokinase family hexose kinase
MKPYILTITLNPAIDKTVIIPNFKVGKDFREKAMFISAGGKGINVSQVLRHLGIPSVTSGFLNNIYGRYIIQQLNKEKILHNFCPLKGYTRTSLTIIDPVLNKITRVLERGPSVKKNDLRLFRKKFLYLTERCKYVIISGSPLPGTPDSFYGELIDIAKKKNILTVFDSSGRAYKLGVKKKPFMIKPNLKEAEELLGEPLVSISKIKKAAYNLHREGIRIVTITMGSRGVVAFNGTEMILAIPPKVLSKNPVGCGDSFIGGFIASHSLNKSFWECIKMGVACGAANVLTINPGFIKLRTIKRILRKVKIENIY